MTVQFSFLSFLFSCFNVLVLAIYTWFQADGALHNCLYHWCLFGSLPSLLHGFSLLLRVMGLDDMDGLGSLLVLLLVLCVLFCVVSLSSGVHSGTITRYSFERHGEGVAIFCPTSFTFSQS